MYTLHVTLPIGTAELGHAEAERLTAELRSFAPSREMPSANAAADKISRILTGQSGEVAFTCPEQFEILRAVDRMSAGSDLSPKGEMFRRMLGLQLAWNVQQYAKTHDPADTTLSLEG